VWAVAPRLLLRWRPALEGVQATRCSLTWPAQAPPTLTPRRQWAMLPLLLQLMPRK
jgi:hypothetical protein